MILVNNGISCLKAPGRYGERERDSAMAPGLLKPSLKHDGGGLGKGSFRGGWAHREAMKKPSGPVSVFLLLYSKACLHHCRDTRKDIPSHTHTQAHTHTHTHTH